MHITIPPVLRQLVKATRFWQENQLVLREMRHVRKIAMVAILCSLMAAILSGSSFGAIGLFLHGLTSPHEPPIHIGLAWFDHWILATDASPVSRLYRLTALIVAIIWLQALCSYLATYCSRYASIKLVSHLRKKLFEQLQSLSLPYFFNKSAGALSNSLTNEVTQLQHALNILTIFTTQGTMLLGCMVVLIWISWPLTLVSIMILSLLSASMSFLRGRVKTASMQVPRAHENFAAVVLEFISGIRTVHAFGAHDFERHRFHQAIEQLFRSATGVAKYAALVEPMTQAVVSTLLLFMVVGAFHFFIDSGQLRATSLLTFLLTMMRTLPLLSHLSDAWVNFNSLQGSMHNVNMLLRRRDKPYLTDGDIAFSGLKKSIDFVHVTFAYETDRPVLRDVTLTIPRGQTTALVGASGAGKSTLVDLIPRFYDPTQGNILVDGIPLTEFSLQSLRLRMAVVSQDTFIFNGSVQYNIAYGLDDIDMDAIWEAAQMANALEFILTLPNGFDTPLGDRGIRLSGGQRQRIAIARALLRNPEILILDEATSALDSITERLIQASLDKLTVGRTVVAIAHRLSTIVRADQIIVLDQGQIVERGHYRELIERQGHLWKYHHTQQEALAG
jgi:subfamily B ATP-binding cassette protein MsbA